MEINCLEYPSSLQSLWINCCQQDEDVIRRDDQDMEDVTTKDQDDLSDKTSDEVKCLYRPALSW